MPGIPDNTRVILRLATGDRDPVSSAHKQDPSTLKTHEALLAAELAADPEFREKWERLALARAIADEVIRYRAEHGLSQKKLADQLGMKQPQVARLELAEVEPDPATIARVVGVIGVELAVSYVPAEEAPALLTKAGREQAVVGRYERGGGAVVVALRSARSAASA
jgi:ribosome-binding protein aMBF1 (putative translation factor)